MLLHVHGFSLPPRPLPFSSSSSAAADLSLLLQRCTTPRQVKEVHAQLLLSTTPHHPHLSFLSAQIIAAYSRFHLLADSLAAFHSTPPPRTPLLHNSILRATLAYSLPHQALSLYHRMRSSPVVPDRFTFPLAIKACSAIADPTISAAVHAQSIVAGHQTHFHVSNELVLMYGNLGRMDAALKVFDRMPDRTVVSWNTLITGFSRNCDVNGASCAFERMEAMGFEPNPVTWTALLSAHASCRRHLEIGELFEELRRRGSAATAEGLAVVLSSCACTRNSGELERGKKIHGYVVRNGFEGYSFVRNSLVCMYGKLGSREDAKQLFEETEVRDLVSWNALISSYAAAGFCCEAYEVLSQMQRTGEVVPNVVSWSAMIGGFASAGMLDRSLYAFREMYCAGVKPNSITVATVLAACAELSALRIGREIHCQAVRGLMNQSLLVGNGLINMYTKSGSLQIGCLVFERIEDKDLITWNTMITGYGMNGLADEALGTFNDMVKAGFQPDGITFVAILSACSHAGRLFEGRQLFDQMIHEYRLSPSMEHYSCMVDLLGRAGLLQEASELVRSMPMEPNACVWGALLNSCRIYGNTTVAEDTLMRIGQLEGEFTGNYMLLSNMYAASGRWEDSARVRAQTKSRGLKKLPGQSWIELMKNVYVFSAGILLPPGAEEAYAVIKVLNEQMESDNRVPEDWLMFNTVSKDDKG